MGHIARFGAGMPDASTGLFPLWMQSSRPQLLLSRLPGSGTSALHLSLSPSLQSDWPHLPVQSHHAHGLENPESFTLLYSLHDTGQTYLLWLSLSFLVCKQGGREGSVRGCR